MKLDARTVTSAIGAARRIGLQSGNANVPVDILSVAREVGVARIEARPLHLDGYLGRLSNGQLVIRYNVASGWRRNRFTIAHEIGHLLIARCQGREINAPIGRSWIRNETEELLANRIAAELLMPEHQLSSDLLHAPAGWNTVHAMCRRYDVSISALVTRVLELQSMLAVLLKIDLGCIDPTNWPRFICRTSRETRVHFLHPPRAAVEAVLKNATSRRASTIKIEANSRLHEIALLGRLMDAGGTRQYWALGWTPNNSTP